MENALTGPVILDGRALARAREPDLARRAAAVTAARGTPPCLALVAFAAQGETSPFIARKVRAARAVGVDAVPTVLPASLGSERAREAVERLADSPFDGIFLEFPFPDSVDGDAAIDAVPEDMDVDVMTAARVRRFLEHAHGQPPVTVDAALALLDAHEIDSKGLDGVVVADASPFADMFRQAFARRGARMRPLLAPDSARDGVRGAELVIAAAARPGLLRSDDLAAGAVVIDAGYFNPGSRGDVDVAPGTAHLRALAPVPGAIGPMTVSVLVQRVIEAAEARLQLSP